MKYKVTHTTNFNYSQAVPVCHNLVHLAPRVLDFQNVVNHKLMIRPNPLDLSQRLDFFGNEVSFFAIDQPHRQMTVTSQSTITVDSRPAVFLPATPTWESIVYQLQHERDAESLQGYQYSFPSTNVLPFPALKEYALRALTPGRAIAEGVMALTTQIFSEFKFDSTATTIHTTTEEVFLDRRGVCQDFAHLQIACLRSLGLAARYVSGYLRTIPPPGKPRLVGVDASHAWLSVYCGSAGWIDFDPTNNTVVGTDYVTVAWGRDYQDVCPIQGIIIGGGEHRMQVSVDVEPLTV